MKPRPPFPEQRQSEPERESAMEPRPDYGYDSYVGLEADDGELR